MKGTDVSIVRVVVSVEIGRWRRKEVVRGLRRFVDRDDEEVSFDKAISSLTASGAGFGRDGDGDAVNRMVSGLYFVRVGCRICNRRL